MFTAGKPASTMNARFGADGRPLPDGGGSDQRCDRRILVVRLGAMGDIIHTLPAVAWLKQSYADSHLTWLVEPRWAPLLEENPHVDRVVLLRRQSFAGLIETRRALRFRGGFSGTFEIRPVCQRRASRSPLRLPSIAGPRAPGRVVLLRQDIEPR